MTNTCCKFYRLEVHLAQQMGRLFLFMAKLSHVNCELLLFWVQIPLQIQVAELHTQKYSESEKQLRVTYSILYKYNGLPQILLEATSEGLYSQKRATVDRNENVLRMKNKSKLVNFSYLGS